MAKTKTDYITKEAKELSKLLTAEEKKLLESKMDLAQRKIKDVHHSRKVRLEIARIKSALRAKELGV